MQAVWLERDDGATTTLWLAGEGTADLPPGTWSYTLTRGYEYAVVTGELTAGTYVITVQADNQQNAIGFADPMSFRLDDGVLTGGADPGHDGVALGV